MTRSADTDTPALASDARRNWIALALAAVVTVVAVLVYSAFVTVGFRPGTVALSAFVFWIVYSASFAILTHAVFARADDATLKRWMTASAPRRGRKVLEDVLAGSGPNINAQWSVLAIIAVALVVLLPGLVESPLANGLAFVVVASSWITTVYSYTVHYARLDAVEPTLDFPGTASGPVFMDYFYLSAQIATTFSSSDVSILTTKGRRVVTGQTMIAFAFSTFIIAMLIGVLFLSE